jgi:hypothetical protein
MREIRRCLLYEVYLHTARCAEARREQITKALDALRFYTPPSGTIHTTGADSTTTTAANAPSTACLPTAGSLSADSGPVVESGTASQATSFSQPEGPSRDHHRHAGSNYTHLYCDQ